MTQLNQIIALEKGVKQKTASELAVQARDLSAPSLLSGISRVYQPKDEDGDQLPPESNRVQVKAEDVLKRTEATLTRLWDITLTKDEANRHATADVVVNGVVLVQGAPVTYLLFLEKQLIELATFVRKLPTLDLAEEWSWDANTATYRTPVTQTTRSKKVMRNHVVAEATAQHPAQVHVYQEDVPVGTWNLVKFSGALPATRVRAISERIDALLDAVKIAREKANGHQVEDQHIGSDLFAYLFA